MPDMWIRSKAHLYISISIHPFEIDAIMCCKEKIEYVMMDEKMLGWRLSSTKGLWFKVGNWILIHLQQKTTNIINLDHLLQIPDVIPATDQKNTLQTHNKNHSHSAKGQSDVFNLFFPTNQYKYAEQNFALKKKVVFQHNWFLCLIGLALALPSVLLLPQKMAQKNPKLCTFGGRGRTALLDLTKGGTQGLTWMFWFLLGGSSQLVSG